MPKVDLISDLQSRGLIAQVSGDDQLIEHLHHSRSVYCGFDPTADSLHIGSLVPLLALRRFQLAGHKPIALVGGATGLIGDPSFKAQERRLNTMDQVAEWAGKLEHQVGKFIDFDCGASSALVVNNLDWMGSMSVLDFLRDVGKHFSVNAMIQKEAVKQRIERVGAGISFTEFSYALLQSYDFAELNRRHGCTVQLGGSDQWGNITAGIDLARRLNRQQVYGVTFPLVTKADGTKFGKTETGTIWLDSAKTSPYAFYQFWMQTADADVYKFLRYFTFLPLTELVEIERSDAQVQGRKSAHGILAKEVTLLVHGHRGLAAAERISQALFSGESDTLSRDDFDSLQQDGMPSGMLNEEDLDKPLTSLLAERGIVKSGKQAKDALGSKGVSINGVAVGLGDNNETPSLFSLEKARYGKYFLVKVGKRNYYLFVRAC